MTQKGEEQRASKKKKGEEEAARKRNLISLRNEDPPDQSRQLTLKQSETYARKYSPEHPTQVKSDSLLSNWIADGFLPYTTLENEQLRKCANHLNRKVTVVSEKKMRVDILQGLTARSEITLGTNSALRKSFRD